MRAKSTVLRDGRPVAIPLEGGVQGDVVRFWAGSLIPADATVLGARDCSVNQVVLTGETYPAKKWQTETVFLGPLVHSGTARVRVNGTGPRTAHGGSTTCAPGSCSRSRRLNAIENFGIMDILCTDKTGMVTVGVVKLDGGVERGTADGPGELAR